MQYYSSGWKKTIKTQKYFNGTSWLDVKQRWVMVGGVWKMLTPVNAVIMYAGAAPSTAILCDAAAGTAYGTPNLVDKYVRGDGTALQSSPGDMLHQGSDHGSGVLISCGSFTPTKGDASVGFTDGAMGAATSHTHAIVSHNHPSAAAPDVPNVTLVPTMGDDKVRANAVFLAAMDTASLAGMTSMTDAWIKRYIKLGSTFTATGGAAFDHGHGNVDWTTGNYSAPGVNQQQPNQQYWQYTHRHTADSHAIGSANIEGPISHHLAVFKTNAEAYFSDLPSGTICAFTSNVLPAGWTAQVYYYIRIWKTGQTGPEADSHNHNSVAYNLTASVAVTQKIRGVDADKSTEFVILAHTHTFSDQHTTGRTNYPPYIRLVWAKKN